MSMISVTLPDGSVNEYASGITAGEIVIDIEGRKHDCVAALVDGEQKDFSATWILIVLLKGFLDSQMKEFTFFDTAQPTC